MRECCLCAFWTSYYVCMYVLHFRAKIERANTHGIMRKGRREDGILVTFMKETRSREYRY